VDLATADDADEGVAGLLDLEAALDHAAVVARHLDRAVVAEHVGGVEHEDVQRVALDPLAAVDEPAELPDRAADLDAAGVLDRRARAHLVGDRADPADARGDVGGLAVAAAAEERFEEARRLVDAQAHVVDAAVADAQEHRALALDAREQVGLDRARLTHALRSRCGTARRTR
jgi:hypothetical protein